MKLNVDKELRRARSHAKRGETAQAEQVYNAVLLKFPHNKRAQQGLAGLKAAPTGKQLPQAEYARLVGLFRDGSFSQVVQDGDPLAADYPDDVVLHAMLGAAKAGLDQLDGAIESYRRALELKPDYAEGHYNLGNVLRESGALQAAEASYARALALKADYAEAHNNLGVLLQAGASPERARASFLRAVELKPDYAEAHNNLGVACQAADDLEGAEESYRRATAIRPDYAEAHHNLAVVLHGTGAVEEAAACCRRALEIRPDYMEANNTLGVIEQAKGRLDEAAALYQRALDIAPDYAEAQNNLGAAFKEKGAVDEAIAGYRRTLSANPEYAEAYNNLGSALRERGQIEEAFVNYRRALELRPDYAEAHYNLGLAMQIEGALDEAVASFDRALDIAPQFELARVHKLFQHAQMCDWHALGQEARSIPALGIEGSSVSPFTMLVLDDDPGRNRARSEKFVQEFHNRVALAPLPRPQSRPARLRIGYFSADCHDHATMHLMAGLLAVHDRDNFEIHLYSYGPDIQDAMRRRLMDTVEHFHEVSGLTDQAVALQARADGIDIAVDLKGHTQDARTGIFAHRAAPIQIAYLGYPGTTGAPFMDYILADATVIPERHRHHYSEQVIHLPHSYQVNDDTRAISDRPVDRAEFGLPDEGVVFCCFNANYKIRPEEFDIWMRLLARVEGSVLWLLKSNRWAAERLRSEAEARGVDGTRIVFADRVPVADHLARHSLADMFLDTFVCNAHTTASDALWAGLPMISKAGDGFAARVGASLLTAIGMPELVAESAEDYEALALALATDRERRDAARQRLARNRSTMPLFDTALFARHLEAAYRQAYQCHFEGRQPTGFAVEPLPRQGRADPAPPGMTAGPADAPGPDLLATDRLQALSALFEQGRFAEVLPEAERLVAAHPDNVVLQNFLGAVLVALGRADQAVPHYRRAIAIRPNYAPAHYNLGVALQGRGETEEAEACYAGALAIQPDHPDAEFNLGLLLQRRGALAEAVSHFRRVLDLEPDSSRAREQLLHQLARMCDWAAMQPHAGAIAKLGIDGPAVSPFSMLVMEDDPGRNRLRSEKVARSLATGVPDPLPPRPAAMPRRLRIGYFSSDYRNHATMYLMARLFEVHDRDAFEIHAYSWGPDSQDAMRRRLVAAADRYSDIGGMTDQAVAQRARADGLDIAVDLKGYTQHARPGIFAHRAAPVQINYLGYPGTTGAAFMDYIVADRMVIPEAERQNYSESMIELPDSYQVNDDTRPIASRAMTRAEFGLPEDGFVFCCFNTAHKIGPAEFDVWMRLLRQVEGSVLWLLKTNPWAEGNLRAQAEARGVDGARVVFAERMAADQHLARYRLADLFVDTFNYNAHTTASDALWAGLPLITRPGRGFAARVGASLLTAVGLPQLIAESTADYEAIALELATDRGRLEAVRRTLAGNRTTAPLFDTARFARHLEQGYRQAYRHYFEGRQPAAIRVTAA